MVTRNSSMRPLCTLAFCSTTWRPVMPRRVLLARSRPPRTASSKLLEDAAVILLTRATLMSSLPCCEGLTWPSSGETWGGGGGLGKCLRRPKYEFSRGDERRQRLLGRGTAGEIG